MKIPVSEPTIEKSDIKAVTDCLRSGWISSAGPAIQEFADKFKEFSGARYALPVATGTAALHLALLALDIKPGDEVIVPALTFVSPISMTAAIGAKPVFVDVKKDSFNLDPEQIEAKITAKTKAIIVVHLYGYPAELNPILKLAKKYNLKVIEDCAEALGAEYQHKQVGLFGETACFSFYGNKFMTTGEGGMITTKNKKVFEKIKLYCDHGMTKERRYYHQVVGFNFRMTAMQASLGLSQLKRLKKYLKQRQEIEKKYKQELKDLSMIEWVEPEANSKTVCWLVTFLLPNKKLRDGLLTYLAEKEIDARKIFYPIPGMPPYPTKEKFPQAGKIAARGLSLPTFSHMSKQQINQVCRTVKQYLKKAC
jgi:perosamine synthetase